MKNPKTYICTTALGMFEMQESKNGNFVSIEDYNKLREENLMLIEAGDDMANVIKNLRLNTQYCTLIDKAGGFVYWYRWGQVKNKYYQ